MIPYSQYVIESQQVTVQNSNSSAQQDDLILSVIEQLKTQVANCTKTNLENKSVNDPLTTKLKIYKEQVKVLKEGQNVDLRSKDNVSDTCAQSVEIDLLKQTLSEHLKEKESLLQTKAQQSKPKLYVGDVIVQTNPIVIPDSEETLALAEECHSKMLSKHKDNMMLEKEKHVDTIPIDYVALNKDFSTRFIPQTELSAEQAFWSKNSVNSSEPTLSIRPTNVEVKALAITALKDELRKLKGKALVDNNVSNHPGNPELYQVTVEPITPKLLNKRAAHSTYIKHSQKKPQILRIKFEHIKANNPLDPLLNLPVITKLIQEMLSKTVIPV
ncbi:hypothetical protein Tco_0054230 [Tanacetum coccineum]